MIDYKKHFISPNATVREALEKLNGLAPYIICFVVDENEQLLGSVTDGDIRRGLIEGKELDDKIIDLLQSKPYKLNKDNLTPAYFHELREKRLKLIPLVDDKNIVIDILNLEDYRSFLPMDAVIMAGGKGTRLRPLTENTPKPLLKVGGKPIIEHTIDRLIKFGIKRVYISINYLGEQLLEYFGDGSDKGIEIKYIEENEFYGTAGALKLTNEAFQHRHLMFMNSDLLTDIDFEDLYNGLIEKEGNMIVSTVPYEVEVPYGVIETEGDQIKALKEKPTYTYYSNAGIYIIDQEALDHIPVNEFYNATDLIEDLIKANKKVVNFPIHSYWLDIGKHHDFVKAQEDIKHLKL
jgi:dTDP-glucose pyrophosphorylase